MFKKYINNSLYCILIFFNLFLPVKTFAIVNPLIVDNNKYGIHVIDENDLINAAALVNSSNGSWGYITLVITQNDRDLQKWNNIFAKLYKLELIPIIRLATELENSHWLKAKEEQAKDWAIFLANLNWYTKNRYIIIFNEPNHAKEWGGNINPVEYAQILKIYSLAIKDKSENFFILPAGLDASAPDTKDTMDEISFISKMLKSIPNIYDYIDGWTSHSYPNPGFKGKITDYGRGTLRTFEWEISVLKDFGINRKLPIFITETGWAHQEGSNTYNNYYSADIIADFIIQAAETIWSKSDIVAITPFILNYQSTLFSNFSWQKDENYFYPQYDSYRSIPKIAGKPELDTEKLVKNQEVDNQGTKGNQYRIFISYLFTKLFTFH